MTDKGLILGIVAVLTCAPAALAQNADVSGTWTATFITDGQSYPATMVLNKEGDKTTGTISSERGEFPMTIAVNAKTATFSFTMQGENGPIPIMMKADVDGDTMKGTFDHGGGNGVGTWSATRGAQAKEPPKSDAPAEKVDVTGAWAFAPEMPDIKATPTVVFKQDGESLSGEYQSQTYGRFPLKGTIKGQSDRLRVRDVDRRQCLERVVYRDGRRQRHDERRDELRRPGRRHLHRCAKEIDPRGARVPELASAPSDISTT
jgi:hypothetical protein